jgi:hypothetical protein
VLRRLRIKADRSFTDLGFSDPGFGVRQLDDTTHTVADLGGTMSETTWEQLKANVNKFISRPSPQPPYRGPVDAEVEDSVAIGREFIPEASYFSVKLVEMRLAEGGKYFVEFLPLGVCVAEYTYGAERRRVPLVLSNETVKQMLGDTAGSAGHVSFANMPIVRRVPMKQDNLALFVGLFRMPFTDIARSVLQLAADVSEELGGVAFGAGTRVATKLYDRVAEIFTLSTVQPRFAFLDGMALTKSGYWLVSGPLPPTVEAKDFVVEKGRLRLRGTPTAQPPADLDYCLLAIEHSASLFPASEGNPAGGMLRSLAGLPFHARWHSVSSFLVQHKAKEADEALLELKAEVIASPDLTEEDRLVAVSGYDIAYTQYTRLLLDKDGKADTDARGPETRGSRTATPVTELKALALSRKDKGDNATGNALDAIALHYQIAEGRRGQLGDKDLDDVLAETFSAMRAPMAIARAQGARAATLATALSIGRSSIDVVPQ